MLHLEALARAFYSSARVALTLSVIPCETAALTLKFAFEEGFIVSIVNEGEVERHSVECQRDLIKM